MRYINVVRTYYLTIVKIQTKAGPCIATKKLKHAHIPFNYSVARYETENDGLNSVIYCNIAREVDVVDFETQS